MSSNRGPLFIFLAVKAPPQPARSLTDIGYDETIENCWREQAFVTNKKFNWKKIMLFFGYSFRYDKLWGHKKYIFFLSIPEVGELHRRVRCVNCHRRRKRISFGEKNKESKPKMMHFFLIFLLFMPNYEGSKKISFLSIPQVGEKKLSQHLHNRPSHSLTSVMLKQLITFEWMVGSLISFLLNSSEFRQCCNRPIFNAVTCPARA